MNLALKMMLKIWGTRWHYMFLATEASDFHPCTALKSAYQKGNKMRLSRARSVWLSAIVGDDSAYHSTIGERPYPDP